MSHNHLLNAEYISKIIDTAVELGHADIINLTFDYLVNIINLKFTYYE